MISVTTKYKVWRENSLDLVLEKGSLSGLITFQKTNACHSMVLDRLTVLAPDLICQLDLQSFPWGKDYQGESAMIMTIAIKHNTKPKLKYHLHDKI